MTEDEEHLIRIRALNRSLDKFLEVINEAESMNDYEMMNQRVDQLREHLRLSQDRIDKEFLHRRAIMEELLDTRRQITNADKQAKLVLGNR